jgi:hypothetical protein
VIIQFNLEQLGFTVSHIPITFIKFNLIVIWSSTFGSHPVESQSQSHRHRISDLVHARKVVAHHSLLRSEERTEPQVIDLHRRHTFEAGSPPSAHRDIPRLTVCYRDIFSGTWQLAPILAHSRKRWKLVALCYSICICKSINRKTHACHVYSDKKALGRAISHIQGNLCPRRRAGQLHVQPGGSAILVWLVTDVNCVDMYLVAQT